MLVALIGLATCAALIGGGGGGGSKTTGGGSTTQEKAQKERASQQKKEKASEDPNPNFGDGTQRVGSDIEAGTYRTREGSQGCYYARLRTGFKTSPTPTTDLNELLR